MNSSGDAAEQVVRLSLEGFEVVAKVTGEAAKNMALLLISALKNEQQTKGKARLSKMIRSGKELKVFTVQKKDLKEFTKHAKKYGVLYTVLRDKNNKDGSSLVDIIARAEDASKIQRIMDRFDLTKVDKGTIVKESEKAIKSRKDKASGKQETKGENEAFFGELFADEDKSSDRKAAEKDKPQKSELAILFDEKAQAPVQKDKNAANPTLSKTEKSPPLERNSTGVGTLSDEVLPKSPPSKSSLTATGKHSARKNGRKNQIKPSESLPAKRNRNRLHNSQSPVSLNQKQRRDDYGIQTKTAHIQKA